MAGSDYPMDTKFLTLSRIRQIYWKQWKKVRTKFAALRKLGLDDKVAWKWANTRKSYWHTANSWILSTSLTNG